MVCHDEEAHTVQRVADAIGQLYHMMNRDRVPVSVPHGRDRCVHQDMCLPVGRKGVTSYGVISGPVQETAQTGCINRGVHPTMSWRMQWEDVITVFRDTSCVSVACTSCITRALAEGVSSTSLVTRSLESYVSSVSSVTRIWSMGFKHCAELRWVMVWGRCQARILRVCCEKLPRRTYHFLNCPVVVLFVPVDIRILRERHQ